MSTASKWIWKAARPRPAADSHKPIPIAFILLRYGGQTQAKIRHSGVGSTGSASRTCTCDVLLASQEASFITGEVLRLTARRTGT